MVGPGGVRFALANWLNMFRYRHAITNAKSRIQLPETGGGILADEMGMGKSLSILSLITKTLEDAHNWAANRSASSTDGISSAKRVFRATLVVVSSARKFLRTLRNFLHK